MKRLFNKCREAGQSEYRALLDWRNTPTEGVGTSPAQRFVGRRCRTLLPLTNAQLQPRFCTSEDARALQGQKARQQHYYNRSARDLPVISKGDTLRMQLPGQKTWTTGVCTGLQGPRSYGVQVGEQKFRRNRRHLIRTKEPGPVDIPQEELPSTSNTQNTAEDTPSSLPEQQDNTRSIGNSSEPDRPGSPIPSLRQSQRNRKPPEWITNYVPS